MPLPEAAGADPGFQLGDRASELAVLRRHLAPARRRRIRIDSDGRLQRRRAIDARKIASLSASCESRQLSSDDDLLGDLLLEREEGIVLRTGLRCRATLSAASPPSSTGFGC
jgi:hypothetical protein